jgi:hypothetical protein
MFQTTVPQPFHPHIESPPIAIKQEEEPLGTDGGTLPPDLIPVGEYVAICLAVKGQSRDLDEFLTHHYHHTGIRRSHIMEYGVPFT